MNAKIFILVVALACQAYARTTIWGGFGNNGQAKDKDEVQVQVQAKPSADFLAGFNGVLTSLSGAASNAASGLQAQVGNANQLVTSQLGNMQNQVTSQLSNVQQQAQQHMTNVQQQAQQHVSNMQSQIQNAHQQAQVQVGNLQHLTTHGLTQAQSSIQGALSQIKDHIGAVIDQGKEMGEKFQSGMTDVMGKIQDMYEEVAASVTLHVGQIIKAGEEQMKQFVEKMEQVKEKMVDRATADTQKVFEFFDDLISKIKNKANLDEIKETMETIAQQAASGNQEMQTAFSGMVGAIQEIHDDFQNEVGKIVEANKPAIENFIQQTAEQIQGMENAGQHISQRWEEAQNIAGDKLKEGIKIFTELHEGLQNKIEEAASANDIKGAQAAAQAAVDQMIGVVAFGDQGFDQMISQLHEMRGEATEEEEQNKIDSLLSEMHDLKGELDGAGDRLNNMMQSFLSQSGNEDLKNVFATFQTSVEEVGEKIEGTLQTFREKIEAFRIKEAEE